MLKSRRRAMASWGQNNAVGIVAAAIIVLALGVMFWQWKGKSGSGQFGPTVVMCAQTECDFQKEFKDAAEADAFFYPPREGTTTEDLMMNHPPEQPVVADCPTCGKKSVLRAMHCPKCNEYFVPHAYMYPMAMNTHHKCPKCQFDPVQARIDEYKARKGK